MALNKKLAWVYGLTALVNITPHYFINANAEEAAEAPQAETPASEERGGQEAMREQRIDVMEYQIEGNSVLDVEDIEKAVQPFLGPSRTVADIEQARDSLEQAYRKKGYETVGIGIPDQDVRSGIVRFSVTELRVGQLRVTGADYYSPNRIKERVPSLAEGVVPRYDLVAKDIGSVNNARDRTITPSLRAGTAPGTVDVDLEVEDRVPFHGSFEINDRYTSQTERLRAVASLSYANLFQLDHSINIQAQVAPEAPSESMVFSASYLAPIPDSNFSIVAYGVYSDSDVAAVGGIDVLGKGKIFGLRGVLSLPSSGMFSHQILAGIDYKDFKEDLLLGSDSATTPISYMPLSLTYSLSSLDKTGVLEASTSLNWGTRLLGSSNDEFAFKRYGARANFIYLRADAKRTQKLPSDFKAIISVSGQISDQPLISNEGFSIGGYDNVRGYTESQAIGDLGLQASVQLETPSIDKWFGEAVNEWRFFVFGDWGHVRIKDALPDIDGNVVNRITLMSTGVGTQLKAFDHFNGLLYVARPLKDRKSVDLDIGDDLRLGFRVWAEF